MQAAILAEPSRPSQNSFLRPLLTDLYQISMAYAHWDAGRHDRHAVFDLYFRKGRMFLAHQYQCPHAPLVVPAGQGGSF